MIVRRAKGKEVRPCSAQIAGIALMKTHAFALLVGLPSVTARLPCRQPGGHLDQPLEGEMPLEKRYRKRD